MKRMLVVPVAVAVAAIAISNASSSTSARADGQAPSPPVIHESFTAMPCPKEPISTLDMEGCIEHKLLATDRKIDRLDKKLFESLRGAGAQRHFVAGHRAWLTYRRTDCEGIWERAEEGTIYPLLAGNCEVARNQQRIADLREAIAYPEKP